MFLHFSLIGESLALQIEASCLSLLFLFPFHCAVSRRAEKEERGKEEKASVEKGGKEKRKIALLLFISFSSILG